MVMQQIQFGSGGRMSMPLKIAATIFGVLVLLPIFALLLFAGIVASVVFGVLLLIGVVNTKFRSLFNRDSEGRKNVRIKR
jgi:uncharacterized membrane protein YphA (DoxX/SURF4 family)